ncbi:hypothetical protein D3C80_1421310 [compost metagenome]
MIGVGQVHLLAQALTGVVGQALDAIQGWDTLSVELVERKLQQARVISQAVITVAQRQARRRLDRRGIVGVTVEPLCGVAHLSKQPLKCRDIGQLPIAHPVDLSEQRLEQQPDLLSEYIALDRVALP